MMLIINEWEFIDDITGNPIRMKVHHCFGSIFSFGFGSVC